MSGARTKPANGQHQAAPDTDFAFADSAAGELFDGAGSPMAAIMAELDAVANRGYGQFCGVVRAVEVVGERWAPLIIRDLLVSSKTIVELRDGLPSIPADLLGTRLRELDKAGVVRRVESDGVVRYEMTEYGAELDDIILRLGRWGVRLLDQPKPHEIITPDSVITSMRATFQPAAAAGVRVTFQMHIGPTVVHVRVQDGQMRAHAGPAPDADLKFEPGLAFKGLLTGEVDPLEAVEDGSVSYEGDPALVGLFFRLFRLRTG